MAALLVISSAVTAAGQNSLPRRPDLGAVLGVRDGEVVVFHVRDGSAADRADLRVGDRIVSIDDGVPADRDDLEAITSGWSAGDRVTFALVRDGRTVEVAVRLSPLPAETIPGARVRLGSVTDAEGTRLRTILTIPEDGDAAHPGVFVAPWLSCDSVESPFPPEGDGMMRFLHDLAARSGHATMRVDRPGVGDSEGGPCSALDFETELAGYQAAFESFVDDPAVDADRVVVLGLSNGGGFAPLVPLDRPVAGYVVIGGWYATWYEHMLEHERTRLRLEGHDPGAVTERLRGYRELYRLVLVEGMSPTAATETRPDLADLWYGSTTGLYGRPARFHRQLEDLNLAAVWARVDVPTLAIVGAHDWIMSVEDNARIVATVNGNRVGAARLEVAPRMDHFLRIHPTAQASYDGEPGTYAAEVAPLVIAWLDSAPTRGTGDPDEQIRFLLPDRPITAPGESALPLVEPHTAVDPADPDHVVVGVIAPAADPSGPWHCAVYATSNGGGAWTRSDFDMERCIDPWITFLSGREVLFTGIEIRDDAGGEAAFRLVAFRSLDGGRTWSAEPEDLGRRHDHQVLLREPDGDLLLASRRVGETSGGRLRHRLNVERSSDDGRSFERLAELLPNTLARNATGLVRLSDGTIVLSSWDFQRDVDGYDREGMLGRARTWAHRSADGGATFAPPALISDACESGVVGAFPGYPFLAVDRSEGQFRDRLYHVCVRPGLEGVALVWSDDGGARWSDPLRVDPPPVDGAAHARTAMVAVAPDGVVGVAWYDRRHDPARECQDLYFTASVDGGRSVIEPVRVSTETSCPDTPGNGRVSTSWPMGGDYSSIAAAPDGTFRLVWADSRDGRFRLREAVVAVEAGEPGP